MIRNVIWAVSTVSTYIVKLLGCMSILLTQVVRFLMHSYVCRHCRYKTLLMFLSITFLLFNRFSIQKKFWKAENQGFPTTPSNTMYLDTVDTSHKISNAFSAKMYWQCQHCQYRWKGLIVIWTINCFDLLYWQYWHETQHTIHFLFCIDLSALTISTHTP